MLEGVGHILAEAISELAAVRDAVRRVVWKTGKIVTTKAEIPEGEGLEYRDYFNYSEPVAHIPPHRVLAINRGDKEGPLKVKLEVSRPDLEGGALRPTAAGGPSPRRVLPRRRPLDALDRLLLPSMEREVRRDLTELAERHAVDVFARNLRSLLLQPPIPKQVVLAIDPGFRTGCKVAVLDGHGNLLEHGVIHPHPPQNRRSEAKLYLKDLVGKHQVGVVAIGNGTACRETEELIAEIIAEGTQFFQPGPRAPPPRPRPPPSRPPPRPQPEPTGAAEPRPSPGRRRPTGATPAEPARARGREAPAAEAPSRPSRDARRGAAADRGGAPTRGRRADAERRTGADAEPAPARPTPVPEPDAGDPRPPVEADAADRRHRARGGRSPARPPRRRSPPPQPPSRAAPAEPRAEATPVGTPRRRPSTRTPTRRDPRPSAGAGLRRRRADRPTPRPATGRPPPSRRPSRARRLRRAGAEPGQAGPGQAGKRPAAPPAAGPSRAPQPPGRTRPTPCSPSSPT